MVPYVLKGCEKIPNDTGLPDEVIYDSSRQIWTLSETGQPFVSARCDQAQASTYGETSLSETREGADQSEIATLQASTYGETALTKTFEGADQPEGTLTSSQYGETAVTATQEGVDQSEVASMTEVGFDAPYSHF
jgi:hypothetical protein